jgi:general secretion pathway protein A
MYEQYFGFVDLPFRVTPEARFFYSNPTYQQALATLRHGIETRRGFIVITGEVGAGKTTLLKILMNSVGPHVHTAFVFNPKISFTELLRLALNDLNIPPARNDKAALIEQLDDYLIEQRKKNHTVALLLDEAQGLSDELLEDLRLCSNFETREERLIQIVLMGQPELEHRLDQPALRQLKEQVALQCRLAPLNDDEIRRYIEFRLKTVGYEGTELFDLHAVERISRYSSGIPRLINVICDNALLIAYAANRYKITGEIVEEVAHDLRLTAPARFETLALTGSNVAEDRADVSENAKRAPEFALEERLAVMTRQRDPRRSLSEQLPSYATRELIRLGSGILLLLLLVTAGGAALYYQPGRDYVSSLVVGIKGNYRQGKEAFSRTASGLSYDYRRSKDNLAAEIKDHYQKSKDYFSIAAIKMRDFADAQWQTLKRIKPLPEALKRRAKALYARAPNLTPANEIRTTQEARLTKEYLRGDGPATAKRNKPDKAQMAKSNAALRKNRAGKSADKPEAVALRPSQPRQYVLPAKAENVRAQNSVRKKQFFPGHYEVFRNSVVFNKPQREASIVATLPPRTWVRVEDQVGNYLRVRSLNDLGFAATCSPMMRFSNPSGLSRAGIK